MKDLWRGIAILGIWVGMGISAPHLGVAIIAVAPFAFLGTLVVAGS